MAPKYPTLSHIVSTPTGKAAMYALLLPATVGLIAGIGAWALYARAIESLSDASEARDTAYVERRLDEH